MKIYKMELLVACHDDEDYLATKQKQKDNRLLTSDMLNGLTDMKQKDPKLVNGIMVAAGKKDINTIIKLGMSKLNPFNK